MKGGFYVLLLERIRDVLWGMPTLALLICFGAYFTVKCGLLSPFAVPRAFKNTFFAPRKKADGNNLSPLSALATALGGTVGVGSISGVALAISVGGAGSIFWMWICSFLGMGLKYAEVALAHSRRKSSPGGYRGGAMYCLKEMGYGKTAAVFALLTVLCAAAGGGVVQAGAVSDIIAEIFPSAVARAAIIAAVTLTVIWGGRKSISKVNAVVLPAVSALFIIASLAVVVAYGRALPEVFARIFSEAFGLRQAAGGVSGAVMMKVGCVRGTFSHEAGMGSSPLSYAASEEADSHTQGLWGVTEVFIDSFVVSTLTALAVLCTSETEVGKVFALCFGKAGVIFYGIALGMFAFAAIISWCFYGEEALYYIAPRKKTVFTVFKLAVALGAALGALMSARGAFALADIWGALMLFPNLFLLYKSRSDVIALAKQKHRRST